jgi:hypothetical protein
LIQRGRQHRGRGRSSRRGGVPDAGELVPEDDVARLLHGVGEEAVVLRLPLEGGEREVEADHLGARLGEPLDEGHVLAPRPGGGTEARDALLVDADDHDLRARVAGGAERLPEVEEHQIGAPQDGGDLRDEAQDQQHGYDRERPLAHPAAGDHRFVEETASCLVHENLANASRAASSGWAILGGGPAGVNRFNLGG